jgi:hypothetical protein
VLALDCFTSFAMTVGAFAMMVRGFSMQVRARNA